MVFNSGNFSLKERWFLLFLFLLLLVALFGNLGIYPLYLEEPRRGLIALEMIFNDNYWVPTQTGDLYFRKPPFYNWLLILSYRMFGHYSELATRFVSVASLLLTGAVVFNFLKTEIGKRLALYSALSYVVAVDILFYFSMIGEIDLFYALITFLVFVVIYNRGKKEKYWSMFLLAYFFSAIGFLTKGLTSIPFVGISLLVFLLMEGKWKKLFSIQHIAGLLLFFFIVGGYFWKYNQYEDVAGWYATLVSESADKAVGSGTLAWLKHVVFFPLTTLANILPAAFFLPLLFVKRSRVVLRENRFMIFLLLLFVANFWLYWFSSEAKSRYVYALFPLLITVLLFAASKAEYGWLKRYLNVIIIAIASIGTLAFPVMLWVKELEIVDNLLWVVLALEALMLFFWWLFLKKGIDRYLLLIFLLVVFRLGYSLTVPVLRQKTTGAAADKALGIEIAKITKGEPLHRLGDVRMSLSIVYYLERDREDVISQENQLNEGYYFVYETDLPTNGYNLVKAFDYHDEPIYLIRLNRD